MWNWINKTNEQRSKIERQRKKHIHKYREQLVVAGVGVDGRMGEIDKGDWEYTYRIIGHHMVSLKLI